MTATFRKAFFDSRRGLLWLSVGLALYAMMVMSFYPILVEQSEDFDEMIEAMPKQLIGMFYSGDLDEFSVSDPGIFLQGRYMLWAILILGVTVGGQAFGAFINAERTGTMDIMLSLPISRRNYFLGRVMHTALTIVVILLVSFAVFAMFSVFMDEFSLSMGELALAIMSAFFPVMAMAGFAYMIAVLVPSSKNFGGPLVYFFIFGAYMLHSFSATIDELEPIRGIFLFNYYDAGEITRNGLDIVNLLVMGVVAVIYFGIAYWYVDKKELGV